MNPLFSAYFLSDGFVRDILFKNGRIKIQRIRQNAKQKKYHRKKVTLLWHFVRSLVCSPWLRRIWIYIYIHTIYIIMYTIHIRLNPGRANPGRETTSSNFGESVFFCIFFWWLFCARYILRKWPHQSLVNLSKCRKTCHRKFGKKTLLWHFLRSLVCGPWLRSLWF